MKLVIFLMFAIVIFDDFFFFFFLNFDAVVCCELSTVLLMSPLVYQPLSLYLFLSILSVSLFFLSCFRIRIRTLTYLCCCCYHQLLFD